MNEARTGLAIRFWVLQGLIVLVFLALVAWRLGPAGQPASRVWAGLSYALPTGFVGSLVSGATGAGGGFVYVPVFDLLRDAGFVQMTFHQNIGTAFLVQVFGLSAAALGWLRRVYAGRTQLGDAELPSEDLIGICFTTLCLSIPSILITQALVPLADRTLQTAFMIFALALGGALMVFAWVFRGQEVGRDRLDTFDLYMFMLIGVAGGYITAFFSVGIGEFLVVYLIFRRFPVYGAVAAALVVSALTVFAGLWYNIAQGRAVWEVGLGAIPGALVGGVLACWLGTWLGPLWMKTLLGLWITGSSLYLIVRALS